MNWWVCRWLNQLGIKPTQPHLSLSLSWSGKMIYALWNKFCMIRKISIGISMALSLVSLWRYRWNTMQGFPMWGDTEIWKSFLPLVMSVPPLVAMESHDIFPLPDSLKTHLKHPQNVSQTPLKNPWSALGKPLNHPWDTHEPPWDTIWLPLNLFNTLW